MRVVALIMAGGRSKRFGGNIEKPIVRFMGKPLIRRVIEATKESKRITETYVAVTSYSPKTAREAAEASVKIIETKGQGYHADLQQAVQEANLTCPVLAISSDLPLLNGEFLDEIIGKYEESGKPALTVLVPEEAFRKYGVSAVSPYEHEGKMYAVSGINILDGRQVLEEQEQEVIFSRRPEAVFNVNSSKDLESAKNYLLRTRGDSKRNKD
ncbi:MAG: NTP transferase domain-containing protein [Candidatus Bathyarchaeum sp.]|nr:MAG: NTP transferase domain-containing protein [Candidatus Bathyarchaeum sp.]